jgi:hypothetical protein
MNLTLWVLMLVLGAGASAAGVLLLASGLFGDRARGRRRCPACWYSLAGVPGLTCPECGATARGEPALFATRRRWRRALLGAMLAGVGVLVFMTPRLLSRGWLSVLPSPLLVLLTPSVEEEDAYAALHGTSALMPVSAELKRRLLGAGFTAGEWREIVERSRMLYARERWPVSREAIVAIRGSHWLDEGAMQVAGTAPSDFPAVREGAFWPDEDCFYRQLSAGVANEMDTKSEGVQVILEPPSGATQPATAALRTTVRVPLDKPVRAPPGYKPVDTPESNRLVRKALKVGLARLGFDGGPDYAVTIGIDRKALGTLAPVFQNVAVSCHRVRDGKGERWKEFAGSWLDPESPLFFHPPSLGVSEVADAAERAGWVVVIRGTPAPGKSGSFWAGEVVIPLNEVEGWKPEAHDQGTN